MAKSDFSCGRNAFFYGSRFYQAVLFSHVPKKCTDLNVSLLYTLILGTFIANSHAKIISCLCVHDVRTVVQRSCGLCGDSKSSLKRFVEGVGKSKSGSWNDKFSDNAIFQFDITRCFCGISDFHVTNFWEHSRIRSCWFNLIHLHCSKINQSDM